jgi:4-hydroxy-2-oxovalerate/4-hydroxy-2-oxohexanoate aldolase
MTGGRHLHLLDATLRDGSHPMGHSFTREQIAAVAAGLDAAGLEYVEISHGDGLGGSSINYGRSLLGDEEMLAAAAPVMRRSKLTVLLLPGIGTQDDLEMAARHGVKAVRVATHVTEADIAEQHIGLARKLGMEAFGFLMMAHMAPPQQVAEQARLFQGYGADVVYVADSAGTMLPDDVKARVAAVAEAVKVPVGYHAHNNLAMAVANSVAAAEAGASFLDGTCRGLGAGAGNAQIEVLVGVLEKLGYHTGVDFYGLMDVAEGVVEPMMKRPQIVNKAALMMGYAGVYSSFLLFTQRAAQRFGVDARDILLELGKRRMVGGQEDMIIDVAYGLAQARKARTP